VKLHLRVRAPEELRRRTDQIAALVLTAPDGQQTIADYKIDGEKLFFPNYRKPGS